MQEMRTRSSKDMDAAATDMIRTLAPRAAATVIALSGELGAGKTTFAQAVARALGVAETVNSPTFVIQKIYSLEGQRFSRLVHIDAYRLKGDSELEALGWNEVMSDPSNLVLIEWPERVPGLIPSGALRLRFDIEGDGRIITIDGGEESSEKAG